MTNTKFIAEVASNHNGNLDRCLEFIQTTRNIGCWGVKFQLFELNNLFSNEALTYKPELLQRKNWELPRKFLSTLTYEASKYGLAFGVTPFDVDAVDFLYPYVDFYKIASYNILDIRLIRKITVQQKPIILSTGAATLTEIDTAIRVIKDLNKNADLTVLHCVSAYPTPVDSCNLQMIDRLKTFKVKSGWSDHSGVPAVIYRAVHKYNSDTVEFHLDLEDNKGIDSGIHCWHPSKIKEVINNCKLGFLADGTTVKVEIVESVEEKERNWRADPKDGLRPLLAERQRLLYASD